MFKISPTCVSFVFLSFARYFELSRKPPNIKLFLLDSIDSISSGNELNLRALGSTKLTTT